METTFSGEYLSIDPQDETELIRILRDHGSVIFRDDDLINKMECSSKSAGAAKPLARQRRDTTIPPV